MENEGGEHPVIVCANIAAMKALSVATTPVGTVVYCLSYGPVRNKGGGHFELIDTGDAPDDVLVFLPDNELGPLRWLRVVQGDAISFYDAGAICNTRGTEGGEDGALTTGDGSINVNDDVFSAPTLNTTSADVGRRITIRGAGVDGRSLNTFVAEILSGDTVRLAAPAVATVAQAHWACGTSDSSAITRAMAVCNARRLNLVLPAASIGTHGNWNVPHPNIRISGTGMYKTWIRPLVDEIHGFNVTGNGVTLADLGVRGVFADRVGAPEVYPVAATGGASNFRCLHVAMFDGDDSGIRIGRSGAGVVPVGQKVMFCHVNGTRDGSGIEVAATDGADICFNRIDNVGGHTYGIRAMSNTRTRINFNVIRNYGWRNAPENTGTNNYGGIVLSQGSMGFPCFGCEVRGNVLEGGPTSGPAIRINNVRDALIEGNHSTVYNAVSNIWVVGNDYEDPWAFRALQIRNNTLIGGTWGILRRDGDSTSTRNDLSVTGNQISGQSEGCVRFGGSDETAIIFTGNSMHTAALAAVDFGSHLHVTCSDNELLDTATENAGFLYDGVRWRSLGVDDSHLAGIVAIADDDAINFGFRVPGYPTQANGYVEIATVGSSPANRYTLSRYRIGGATQSLVEVQRAGITFAAPGTVLTGTTGVDGEVTLSAVAARFGFYLENRAGGPRTFRVTVR